MRSDQDRKERVTFLVVVAAILCLATLLGCTREKIRHQAIAYNKALSSHTNQLILLNAVRASKRYPMYFSALGDMTANANFGGSLTGNFPFGRDASRIFSLSPTLNSSSGYSSLTIANLQTGEFQSAILQPMPIGIVDNYIQRDWPKSLIYHMAYSKVAIAISRDRFIDRNYRAICANPRRRVVEICADIQRADEECLRPRLKKSVRGRSEVTFVEYRNAPRERCEFRRFQSFLNRMLLLRPRLAQDQGSGWTAELTDYRGRAITIPLSKTGGPPILSFYVRSPHDMIAYLGDLIAAQQNPYSGHAARIFVADFVAVPLFVLKSTTENSGPSAFSVRHENRIYAIPQPGTGQIGEHRSLQALAFISQVIGLKTSRSALPPSPAVLVGR